MTPGTAGVLFVFVFLGFFLMLCAMKTTKLGWFMIFAINSAACFSLSFLVAAITT
jgi:hypothetical protein